MTSRTTHWRARSRPAPTWAGPTAPPRTPQKTSLQRAATSTRKMAHTACPSSVLGTTWQQTQRSRRSASSIQSGCGRRSSRARRTAMCLSSSSPRGRLLTCLISACKCVAALMSGTDCAGRIAGSSHSSTLCGSSEFLGGKCKSSFGPRVPLFNPKTWFVAARDRTRWRGCVFG